MLLLWAGVAWAKAPPPPMTENDYVQFRKNIPFAPGSLNLYGYETMKSVYGFPVLSPDKRQMAVTEVAFLPTNRQTFSRVFLIPVGQSPSQEQITPPPPPPDKPRPTGVKKLITREKEPEIKVDPHAFWDRYSPEKQVKHRKTIFEVGYQGNDPFRVDIVQVGDWSSDGRKLLMTYRPGGHHQGILKTLPVVYDLGQEQATRLTLLPKKVWDDYTARTPEFKAKAPPWDIRVLGWSAQAADAFVVKLVMFKGQSEWPLGFWECSSQSSQVRFLGDTLDPATVARHGWLALFTLPPDKGEQGASIATEPGQIPEKHPTEKSWRDRLRFRKK